MATSHNRKLCDDSAACKHSIMTKIIAEYAAMGRTDKDNYLILITHSVLSHSLNNSIFS